MPTQKATKTLPLFPDTTDVHQSRGFKSGDDREFEREQKRKSRGKKHVPLAQAPRTGPACLRCSHWLRPIEGDEFGHCRHLVMMTEEAAWLSVPKGTVVSRQEAFKDLGVAYDYLRTGEAFSCSDFDLVEEEVAA